MAVVELERYIDPINTLANRFEQVKNLGYTVKSSLIELPELPIGEDEQQILRRCPRLRRSLPSGKPSSSIWIFFICQCLDLPSLILPVLPPLKSIIIDRKSLKYIAVPQQDLEPSEPEQHVEELQPNETHLHSLSKTSANVHTHCATCDQLQDKQNKRRHEALCCAIVGLVFVMAFICVVIIVSIVFHHRRW